MAAFPSGRLFRGRSRVRPLGEMCQVPVSNNLLTEVSVFSVALKLLSGCDAGFSSCGTEASLWL